MRCWTMWPRFRITVMAVDNNAMPLFVIQYCINYEKNHLNSRPAQSFPQGQKIGGVRRRSSSYGEGQAAVSVVAVHAGGGANAAYDRLLGSPQRLSARTDNGRTGAGVARR